MPFDRRRPSNHSTKCVAPIYAALPVFRRNIRATSVEASNDNENDDDDNNNNNYYYYYYELC